MKTIGKSITLFVAIFTFCMLFVNSAIFADTSSHGGGGTSFESNSTTSNAAEEYEKKKETEYQVNNSKLHNVGNEFNYGEVPSGSVDQKIKTPIQKLFSSILLILQIASVGGVAFAGVRYMFSSSEVKADIKNSMIHLVIGMIIVFAASTIINLIIDVFNDII